MYLIFIDTKITAMSLCPIWSPGQITVIEPSAETTDKITSVRDRIPF